MIGGEDRIPYVYSMDRPKNMKIADDTTLVRQLERQNGSIAALAWSPDGKYIAVAGAAPEVTVYDAESGARVAAARVTRQGFMRWLVAGQQDGGGGGFDGQVRLYDAATGSWCRSSFQYRWRSRDENA